MYSVPRWSWRQSPDELSGMAVLGSAVLRTAKNILSVSCRDLYFKLLYLQSFKFRSLAPFEINQTFLNASLWDHTNEISNSTLV